MVESFRQKFYCLAAAVLTILVADGSLAKSRYQGAHETFASRGSQLPDHLFEGALIVIALGMLVLLTVLIYLRGQKKQ